MRYNVSYYWCGGSPNGDRDAIDAADGQDREGLPIVVEAGLPCIANGGWTLTPLDEDAAVALAQRVADGDPVDEEAVRGWFRADRADRAARCALAHTAQVVARCERLEVETRSAVRAGRPLTRRQDACARRLEASSEISD